MDTITVNNELLFTRAEGDDINSTIDSLNVRVKLVFQELANLLQTKEHIRSLTVQDEYSCYRMGLLQQEAAMLLPVCDRPPELICGTNKDYDKFKFGMYAMAIMSVFIILTVYTMMHDEIRNSNMDLQYKSNTSKYVAFVNLRI